VSVSDAAPEEARSWVRRHRRSLRVGATVLVVVLVVLAVTAFASWQFSSEVVVPNYSPLSTDVTVEHDASSNQVELSRSQSTLRPGAYGLLWPGGHAIIGKVLHSDSKSVTRSLSAVHGHLQAGTEVAINSEVYVGNPTQALGLPFTTVSVPDELGPMPDWLIPGHGSTWAIVVHGINDTREYGLKITPALYASGLPTLLISYRNDPGAPKSRDGLHHMGLTEWRDLQAAARYALAHGATHLVLIGASMGGAIVTQFMQRSALARDVLGLILDAPALDWKAILSFNAKEMGLPSFAATPVEWMIGARIDANWNLLDALRHPDAFHLPILLFHGTEDETVPIATSNAFARELKGWVTYYRVAHAGHVESWNVDPKLYERRVAEFLYRIGATRTLGARATGGASGALPAQTISSSCGSTFMKTSTSRGSKCVPLSRDISSTIRSSGHGSL
jgi:hypothetical protein